MDFSQGPIGIPLPAIVTNPSRLDKVVRRRSKVNRPTGLVTESLFPSFIPIEVQLSRRHLDALREEIGSAEDVLSNVYEDMDIFKERQSALNEITYSLLRMKDYVDVLKINLTGRQAIKGEIDLLTRQIDLIAETTHRRAIPVLKPVPRIVTFGGDGEVTNKADVVFVVDRSPRMRKDALHLSQTAHVFWNELKNRGVDLRMGVQTFERTSQPSGPMREYIDGFIEDLGAVYFNGTVKNALAAIKDALSEQSFREDAQKFIVIFSDGEAHDDYGTTRDETAAAAREAGATVYAMSASDSFTKSPFSGYDAVARATGGRYFDLNRTPYEDNLSMLAGEIANRMVASGAPVIEAADRYIQIGPEKSDAITVRFPDFRTNTLGLRDMPLESESDFKLALEKIDGAIKQISFDRAEKNILQKYLHRIIDVFDEIRLYKLDFHI
jgi:hypothetical protein